nr:hypothetical protein [Tanacetum cinerariifolium]
EEEADELYRDVDINQGRGLQLSTDIEDSHVILTPVNPDGMESIFATASSPMAPLQTNTPIMTPSTIATIIIISHAPIPPMTIPSEVLQNLPTFDSVFRFEDRLKSLEVNFSKFIQTNQFVESVSNILDKTILDSYGETTILKRRREDDVDQEGPSAESDRGSKRQREGGEPESARAPLEPATRSEGRSTTGSRSLQPSASESAFAEEPVQTISHIEEPSHPVFETGAEDQPIPGVDKTDCHPKNEIHLSQRLLYDNSSPRPPEEFNSKNSNAEIESFSPSPIPNKDSDSFMEEIDLFLTPNDPMPPSIEDDDNDSEGDTLSLERLPHDDPIPLPDTLDFSYKVRIFLPFFTYPVTSLNLHPFENEDTIFDPGITMNHFYFKPGLSHRHGAFKKFNTHRSHLNEWPMIINGKNTPLLDVLLFHFYPP